MRKQLLFLLFGLGFFGILLSPLSVFAQTTNDAQAATKNKAKIETLSVGAVVSVRLQNKKKLKGRIARINPDNFIVNEIESGKEQILTYGEVTQVKQADKEGISTKAKVAVIIVGALIVLSLIGNGFGG